MRDVLTAGALIYDWRRWEARRTLGSRGRLSLAYVRIRIARGGGRSHSRKADRAQRTPGALALAADEALRITGFPARRAPQPGRYAIDAIGCHTSGRDDTLCIAQTQARPHPNSLPEGEGAERSRPRRESSGSPLPQSGGGVGGGGAAPVSEGGDDDTAHAGRSAAAGSAWRAA
jgi:hypothetical protein